MKTDQNKQDSNKTWTSELELLPADSDQELELKPENYDGGFHIKCTANKKRVISKRSGLQDFTC